MSIKKRTCTLATKVSPEEAEKIKQIAEAKGLTISELIRRSVLGLPIPERMSPEKLVKKNEVFRKYLGEVNKIGVNINQVARYCNQYREVDALVLECLVSIERRLTELLDKLYSELTD